MPSYQGLCGSASSPKQHLYSTLNGSVSQRLPVIARWNLVSPFQQGGGAARALLTQQSPADLKSGFEHAVRPLLRQPFTAGWLSGGEHACINGESYHDWEMLANALHGAYDTAATQYRLRCKNALLVDNVSLLEQASCWPIILLGSNRRAYSRSL